MDRNRLKKLAADERFIPGIYNYCDRWCERCSQTRRCLNFALSEEEFSDPETQDIRNEAFWTKLSGVLGETLELLREAGKKWGIEFETLDSVGDRARMRANDEAAENHLICRAATSYSSMVEDWLGGRERLFFETAPAAQEGMDIEEAFDVIRWYQYFITAKLTRAIRGKMEEEEERCDEFASDSDGSAKVALIAMDRSIGAWAVILHCNNLNAERVLEIISFLDRLRQAVEETFPGARSFVRPGFDRIDLNG
ncbi:MAG: hypothetical protein WCO26_08900 [Deltaproteobacteria bacterium]